MSLAFVGRTGKPRALSRPAGVRANNPCPISDRAERVDLAAAEADREAFFHRQHQVNLLSQSKPGMSRSPSVGFNSISGSSRTSRNRPVRSENLGFQYFTHARRPPFPQDETKDMRLEAKRRPDFHRASRWLAVEAIDVAERKSVGDELQGADFPGVRGKHDTQQPVDPKRARRSASCRIFGIEGCVVL